METPSPNRGATRNPWAVALRLLARRDYSCAEVRQRLTAKGFAPEAVDEVVARALDLGYLDDPRLITRLAGALLHSGRAAGPKLLLELRRRGFADELIAATMAAAADGQGEEQALHGLIARRFPAFDFARADDRERRRVVTFLQRRGFPLARILTALRRTDP